MANLSLTRIGDFAEAQQIIRQDKTGNQVAYQPDEVIQKQDLGPADVEAARDIFVQIEAIDVGQDLEDQTQDPLVALVEALDHVVAGAGLERRSDGPAMPQTNSCLERTTALGPARRDLINE